MYNGASFSYNKKNMILDRFSCFGLACIFTLFASCKEDVNNDDKELVYGDYGYCLSFNNIPAEEVQVLSNDYYISEYSEWVNVHIWVQSFLKEVQEYTTPQHYNLQGNSAIESNITEFLDPEGKIYTGTMPLPVKYTTEPCKSIAIYLYSKNDVLVSDITDKAQFHCIDNLPQSKYNQENLLIQSENLSIQRIELNSTIQDYLQYNPMLFGEALFIFPDLPKDVFSNGNYVIVEIKLVSGKTIKAKSTESKRFSD